MLRIPKAVNATNELGSGTAATGVEGAASDCPLNTKDQPSQPPSTKIRSLIPMFKYDHESGFPVQYDQYPTGQVGPE